MTVSERRSVMKTRPRLAAVLTALVVVVVACGGNDGESKAGGDGARSTTAPRQGGTADLAGRKFLSDSVRVGGNDRPLVPSTRISLSFDADGNIGASAGCNQFGGPYEIEGDRLVVGDMAGTEMGCDEPRHLQDQWLVEVLGSEPTFLLDGDRLTLTSGSTVISLLDREVADPDRSLSGTTWVLDTLLHADVATSAPAVAPASIVFAGDGTFEVETGCNSGGGEYTVAADRLTITSLQTTRMACKDAWRRKVEEHMLGLLNAEEIRVRIEAGHLTLDAGEIGGGFTARA